MDINDYFYCLDYAQRTIYPPPLVLAIRCLAILEEATLSYGGGRYVDMACWNLAEALGENDQLGVLLEDTVEMPGDIDAQLLQRVVELTR